MLQNIWKCGLEWDEPLPLEYNQNWRSWCNELEDISNIEVTRHYFEGAMKRKLTKTVQLHCFADASQEAYGAVLYLRYTKEDTVKTEFVVSKARIAPLKTITLPRLELMAALIGARISKTVQKYLGEKLEIVPYFWTDSAIVLHWIKGNPEKWKPFVQNRVQEIQEKTEPSSWSFCPGKENPSDLVTRGIKVADLRNNENWWHGPKWLAEEEDFWPQLPASLKNPVVEEEKRKLVKGKIFQASCIAEEKENAILDLKRFSRLIRILRITAWIKRFIFNTRNKDTKLSGPLTAEEIAESENYWIKTTQMEYFPDELKALKSGKPVSPDSKICSCNPFLDKNNILRVGGRLQNADLNFSEIHPIILPDLSLFSDLEIKRSHEKIGHAGTSETLAQVRETFWVLKGRQRVKSIINRCMICRKFKVKPMTQDVAPLPPDRVRETYPFEVTGIDYAGPLYQKNNEKAYIVLFTCAVTRSVHLELVSNMTTQHFLLAFRRFISRRGMCRVIMSDNAKTFKKTNKDLKSLWNTIRDNEVLDFFGNQGIEWKFIVERAAWWGGFWERLIRSIKSCLKKILLRTSLKYEELETTLIEVEAILNSRPLTYVYSEIGEPEPLTPGHFLVGRRLTSLPTGKISPLDSTKDELTKKHRYRLALVEMFWKRWKREYLLELRTARQVQKGRDSALVLKDSVVLIHEDKTPRLMWKTGVIQTTHPGRDGKIRACTIRLPNGTLIRRPVQLLYPLEIN